jgi:hypothetical protein
MEKRERYGWISQSQSLQSTLVAAVAEHFTLNKDEEVETYWQSGFESLREERKTPRKSIRTDATMGVGDQGA